MNLNVAIIITALFAAIAMMPLTSAAASENERCNAQNMPCLFDDITASIQDIENDRWRDQSFRELAKLHAKNNQTEKAIALIEKIQSPDTQAMTIRGIGMAAAENDLGAAQYNALFTTLRSVADTIDHAPSYAIALTYIAMAQAFAGDDDGAMRTAASMENDALRNKAYAESAEIQAERGDLSAAIQSIIAIDDAQFRDKAYRLVSKIFATEGLFENAVEAAYNIENKYQHSQAMLLIMARQIAPEEISKLD
jgi:hypothetical protein